MAVALTVCVRASSVRKQVPTEDTVLFTAQAYLDAQPDPEQRQAAVQQLAPLIRCPHLSRTWLCAATRAGPEELPLLQPYMYEVGECLQSCPWQQRVFSKFVSSTPASWLRGPRVQSAVPQALQLTWYLSVDELKRAYLEGVESGACSDVLAPSFGRPLLELTVQLAAGPCLHDDGSCTPTVYLDTSNAPACMYTALVATILLVVPGGIARKKRFHVPLHGGKPSGFSNLFQVERMAGGLDEVAWVSQGLPASGELVIDCCVAPST